MLLFAGTLIAREARDISEIDLDIFEIAPRTYFVMGGFEDASSKPEALSELESAFGPLEYEDISIEAESQLELLAEGFEAGIYESVSFDGANTSFEDILERFADSDECICIREAGISPLTGNTIIKADFIY